MAIRKAHIQELIEAVDEGLARNRAAAPSYAALFESEQKTIPGITAADALDAGDTIGSVFSIAVPEAGWINCVRLYDPDDDTLALTLHVFRRPVAAAASDAALAVPAGDLMQAVCSIPLTSTTDLGGGKITSVPGLNEAYTAPDGLLYFQCSTAGTPNIAATAMPRVQLWIIPALLYNPPPLNTV
jgi:hypothetical protein